MEKFLYFMEQTDGQFDAVNDAVCIPVSKFKGFSITDQTTLDMYFEPVIEVTGADGDNNLKVALTVASDKHKEAMSDISRAISHGREPMITISDGSNSIFASSHVTACAITVSG